jgi:nucleoside phosphorylase
METSPLEELLLKIHELQSIMIDVATGKADFRNEEESYTEIYESVDVTIELLQEDKIPVWNPNNFKSLKSWRAYWSDDLSTYALRRKYIRELYIDLIIFIEDALQKRASKDSINRFSEVISPDFLKDFLSEIQDLQAILIAVAGEKDIDVEEANYVKLYQKLLTSIRSLQQAGLPLKNPNNFSSLWHWQNYWLYELEGYASRPQFIGELYTSLVKPVQKALQKHQQRSTSIEEFTEDIRRRFNEQVSEQILASTSANSIVIEEETNSNPSAVLLGSKRALESDFTQSIASQSSVSYFTEPMIDFAIITAIESERLAILEALEVDEDRDRVFKDSRVYWRKQISLGDGKFYEVTVTQLLDMANVGAAIATMYAIEDWKPAVLLMVGIAAAANDDQQLGDLVVGTEIYYYEQGKETDAGKLPEPKMHSGDPTLLGRFNALPQNVKQTFTIRSPRPDQIDIRPKVYSGVIASGEKVIASAAVRQDIQFGHRKIKAIEMEGYGVSRAAWQQFNQVRCLVIRALCDYADSNKHDQWHLYAAAVAAGFTKAFLLDKPLEPRNPPKAPE